VAKFEELDGCKVVACSVDSQFSHLAWTKQDTKEGGLGKMNIPMIADLTKSISQDFGVLLDNGVAARGTFIIDGKGVLRHMSVNMGSVGRSVSEILRLVDAFQYTDEHGVVCPANWDKKDNNATIVPTVSESKEYFKNT
jgi:alkyl hydroperoxide reductase subunit AhpC